jgi:hypothetical protein
MKRERRRRKGENKGVKKTDLFFLCYITYEGRFTFLFYFKFFIYLFLQTIISGTIR